MLHSSRQLATQLVLLLASFAAALTCAAGMIVAGSLRSDSGPIHLGVAFFTAYFFGGLAVAVLVGLPLFALFRLLGLVRWWSAVLGGVAAGMLVALLLNNGPDLNVFLVMAAVGAASGLAFWLVWLRYAVSSNAT